MFGGGKRTVRGMADRPFRFPSKTVECFKNTIPSLFHNVISIINHDRLSTHARYDKGQDDKVTLIERVFRTAHKSRYIAPIPPIILEYILVVINYSPAQT